MLDDQCMFHHDYMATAQRAQAESPSLILSSWRVTLSVFDHMHYFSTPFVKIQFNVTKFSALGWGPYEAIPQVMKGHFDLSSPMLLEFP